jgi:hypothetical protein
MTQSLMILAWNLNLVSLVEVNVRLKNITLTTEIERMKNYDVGDEFALFAPVNKTFTSIIANILKM